ncbi:MAG: hypothetical protein JWR51_2590 [Devosia sp.]|uniref:TetR family transcriptional regulator n=1 Tax=Devosia sp. TaxID=1871048 RepID=UPI00261697A5|nr:TetR family transcriptional regulator [Devosia sp.]MDB5529487.1 hypothetical protein [Devosia sp.]
MAGDATETRKKLLAAATEEFAARGIAGARVDRIAAEAGANKSLIYSYFGSKDGLFAAVYDAQVVLTIDAVPFTADDLPGYAARQFDHHRLHPTVQRLTTWSRLERGTDASPIEAIASSNIRKITAIEAEQAAGRLPTRFSAYELLSMVLAIANMWATGSHQPPGAADIARQRQSIIDAVKLLIG